MAEEKKTSKSKPKKKTKRVDRPYPRATLKQALEVPLVLKEKNGGNPWPPGDVAKAVGIAKSNKRFFYMAAASRDFGLTEGSRDTKEIALTELGRELVYAPDPETENNLKRQAFLNVDVFRKVLDYYKGANLPEMKYLSNTLTKEFGLHPDTHEEFSELFEQNCAFLDIGTGFTSDVATADDDGVTDPIAGALPGSGLGRGDTITLAEPEKGTGPSCFVIMPFGERTDGFPPGFFDEVLKSVIVPAGRKAGFTVATANRQGTDVIQSTIVNELLQADLVIADLTEHNPNVLFELGMRMAFDKPVALIRAEGTPSIFDVDNMLRVFEYDRNLWPSTVEKDWPQLAEHIEGTWKNKDSLATYLKLLRREEET